MRTGSAKPPPTSRLRRAGGWLAQGVRRLARAAWDANGRWAEDDWLPDPDMFQCVDPGGEPAKRCGQGRWPHPRFRGRQFPNRQLCTEACI